MIRPAIPGDLPAIVAIYNEGVASGFATGDLTPVSVKSRQEWFDEHRPEAHPIYVWEEQGEIRGWCSLSPYRCGRAALRFTVEISYYVGANYRRRGIASGLIAHAVAQCPSLQIKSLFAIVLELNAPSRKLMGKLGFEQWGLLPRVAEIAGQECGHVYYGRRVSEESNSAG